MHRYLAAPDFAAQDRTTVYNGTIMRKRVHLFWYNWQNEFWNATDRVQTAKPTTEWSEKCGAANEVKYLEGTGQLKSDCYMKLLIQRNGLCNG